MAANIGNPFNKTEKQPMNYLSLDGIKLLLEQPDQSTPKGKRDVTLLSLMYDSGARVQEMIDLTPSSISFINPYTVRLHGKGNKHRIVPLMENQVELLMDYMKRNCLLEPYAGDYVLFDNGRVGKLTRMGVTRILKKYADMARKIDAALISKTVTPHVLRYPNFYIILTFVHKSLYYKR